jgi:hypothetical protein
VTVTVADPPTTGSDAPGTLTVRSGAVERLVRGVVGAALPGDADPDVEILSLDDEGVELRSTVTLEYPSEPLSAALTRLRRHIAAEVGRLLGRPVRRVDLVVGSFETEPPAPVRRVV